MYTQWRMWTRYKQFASFVTIFFQFASCCCKTARASLFSLSLFLFLFYSFSKLVSGLFLALSFTYWFVSVASVYLFVITECWILRVHLMRSRVRKECDYHGIYTYNGMVDNIHTYIHAHSELGRKGKGEVNNWNFLRIVFPVLLRSICSIWRWSFFRAETHMISNTNELQANV